MTEVKKLIATSRVTEIDTLSGRMVTGYEKKPVSDDPYLAGVIGDLKSESGNLTIAVKRMKAESQLEEADAKRDAGVRAINYLIKGYNYHPDSNISKVAGKAGEIFDHYGMELIKESYAVESSLIDSMLEDFAKPEMQTVIDTLPGLRQLIDELNTSQEEFEAASLIYEQEKSVVGKLESATKIKKKVVSIINDKIVVYLNGMCLANPEKYDEFARIAAQLIDDNNSAVKRRSNKPAATV